MELPLNIPPVSWRRYLGIFPQISYRIVAPLVNVWATIVTTFLQFFKPAPAPLPEPKPYRSVTVLSPSQQTVSFHPALGAAIGQNKAIILQKMLDWMDYNRAINKLDHFIDDEWYTYDSARGWQQRHFYFISVSTVKRLFQELEADGYIKRRQHRKAWGDHRQWVTIPAEARARIDALCVQFTPAQEDQRGDQKNPLAESCEPAPVQKNPQTNRESSNKEPLKLKAKQPLQQQQPTEADVVVVETARPEPQSISGEHSVDGEAEQQPPRGAARGSAIVEAMHREHANDTAPIPSSAPPLSPSAADVLRADLIRFGVMPHTAQRLVDQYAEADIRHVLAYARGERNLQNPPGFVVNELDTRKMGVLVAPLVQPTIHRPPEYFSDRDPLPPAVDDPAWNELIDTCAASIPELKYAVCRAAGDRYEIAVEGPSVYIPLNRRHAEIKQHLEQLTGHPVALTLIVDPRLECDPVS